MSREVLSNSFGTCFEKQQNWETKTVEKCQSWFWEELWEFIFAKNEATHVFLFQKKNKLGEKKFFISAFIRVIEFDYASVKRHSPINFSICIQLFINFGLFPSIEQTKSKERKQSRVIQDMPWISNEGKLLWFKSFICVCLTLHCVSRLNRREEEINREWGLHFFFLCRKQFFFCEMRMGTKKSSFDGNFFIWKGKLYSIKLFNKINFGK